MSEILNANPTIRNASDLPTRRQRNASQSSRQNTLGLFSSNIPSSAYLADPFSAASGSSSDSDSEEDSSSEPIDEQEIYGKQI